MTQKCDWCRQEPAMIAIMSTSTALNYAYPFGYAVYTFKCKNCFSKLVRANRLNLNKCWTETEIPIEQALNEITCQKVLES